MIDRFLTTGDQLLLQIYLNDHRAGATAGVALCRRLAASNEGTDLGRVVAEICDEIEEDAEALDRVFRELGLRHNPVKRAGALVAERMGRLKLNGRITGYSPLSRLLELEGLLAGIDAKHNLWRSLIAATPDGQIADVDLAELRDRAESQRDRLMPFHEEAAAAALTATP